MKRQLNLSQTCRPRAHWWLHSTPRSAWHRMRLPILDYGEFNFFKVLHIFVRALFTRIRFKLTRCFSILQNTDLYSEWYFFGEFITEHMETLWQVRSWPRSLPLALTSRRSSTRTCLSLFGMSEVQSEGIHGSMKHPVRVKEISRASRPSKWGPCLKMKGCFPSKPIFSDFFSKHVHVFKGMFLCSLFDWSLGGQDKIRPLWRHYYQGTNGFLGVGDELWQI